MSHFHIVSGRRSAWLGKEEKIGNHEVKNQDFTVTARIGTLSVATQFSLCVVPEAVAQLSRDLQSGGGDEDTLKAIAFAAARVGLCSLLAQQDEEDTDQLLYLLETGQPLGAFLGLDVDPSPANHSTLTVFKAGESLEPGESVVQTLYRQKQ